MSEVTYDALKKRVTELEAVQQHIYHIVSTGILHQSSLSKDGLIELLKDAQEASYNAGWNSTTLTGGMKMSDDLVTPLRNAAYLAFEDGTNDYTTPALSAARIEKLEAILGQLLDAHSPTLEVVKRIGRAVLSGGKDE